MSQQHQVAAFLSEFESLKFKANSALAEEVVNLGKVREAIQNMSRFVSENAPNIPGYELRKAHNEITEMQSKIQSSGESSRNKGKFKFTRNKVEQKVPLLSGESSVNKLENPSHLVKACDPTLSNLKNETITLTAEQSSSQDLWLNNLEMCTIIIKGIPSALHLTCLTACKIIGGPIQTSIFLEDCSHSSFVLGCQQLRIHKSQNCDFYLHVSSRVIIEDCIDCRFAPYNRY